MANFFRWLENVWNLRKIFDKYLPMVRGLVETIKQLQLQLEDLRQAKIDMEKEIAKLKSPTDVVSVEESNPKPTIVVPEGFECVGEPEYSKYLDRDYYKPKEESRITKVNKYYDPQMGVEYLDFEVNGDKVSPDEDTVKE